MPTASRAHMSDLEFEIAPNADARLKQMLRQNTTIAVASDATKKSIAPKSLKDKEARSSSTVARGRPRIWRDKAQDALE